MTVLDLASILFGGRLVFLLGVCGRQRRPVVRRVGRLELCELCVVVAVVAGDGGAVGVWRRRGGVREMKQSAVKTT